MKKYYVHVIGFVVAIALLSGCAGLPAIKTSTPEQKLAWANQKAKEAYFLVEAVSTINSFAESPSAKMVDRTKEYKAMLLAIQNLTAYLDGNAELQALLGGPYKASASAPEALDNITDKPEPKARDKPEADTTI